MTRYIVDFQGLRIENKSSYIIRELTIVDIDTDCVIHFQPKPPFDFSYLTDAEKRCYNWLYMAYHQIDWNDGNIDYSTAMNIFRRKIRDNGNIIYIKGSDRATFLRTLTSAAVIDLDELHCPQANSNSLRNLHIPLCHYPAHATHQSTAICSLYRAIKYKVWFKKTNEN